MAVTMKGLENAVVAETSVCTVGEATGLTYRGYDIHELAEKASFEEVAFLLIHEKLPNRKELEDYGLSLQKNQSIPNRIFTILEQLPKNAQPMDVLRTSVSVLGSFEPEQKSNDAAHIADRLMPYCISALLYWYYFHLAGKQIVVKTDQTTLAGHFLNLLYHKKPTDLQKQALNTSLILYAEHELNASTFAARVCISTESDIYSAITAAIGTLRGPLHGGANEAAIAFINRFESAVEAEKGVRAALAQKERIMGFGHRVYKTGDPRSKIIKAWAKKLSLGKPEARKFEIAESIEKIILKEKKLYPNLDLYTALVYDSLNIPPAFFTPLFAIARIAGWAAHIIEQRKDNRLIRPLAHYTGPAPGRFVPIEQR